MSVSQGHEFNNQPIRRVGIFLKWRSEDIQTEYKQVLALLEKQKCQAKLIESGAQLPKLPIPSIKIEEVSKECDCVLVLGGDGSMLSAGRRGAPLSATPIIGIHLGQFGFMTQLKMHEFESSLKALMEGRYRIKERPLLQVTVSSRGKKKFTGHCLNDVVVHREHIARMIDLRIKVQDILLSTIRGDGVIIATPLGSTAYSLSAGGPILHPAVQATIITSLCPHTLTHRPVVIPSDYTITIEAADPASDLKLQLTLDGQEEHILKIEDTVEVTRSPFSAKFIDLNTPGKFFETLREKLHWGI